MFGWKDISDTSVLDQMRQNGRYCKSGMAMQREKYPNQAMCTLTEYVVEAYGTREGLEVKPDQKSLKDGLRRKIPEPYECDPTDSNKFCWLFFNKTEYHVDHQWTPEKTIATECKCSLGQRLDHNGVPKKKDGGGLEGEGYCGNILGTSKYIQGLALVKPVLEGSKCHTLDRYNW